MKTVDMKLEVVDIPVSDVERAKRFYGKTWAGGSTPTSSSATHSAALQFTPPGSPCSIHFGKGVTSAAPGSATGLFLVVSDIEAARAELVDRGVAVSEIFHRAGPGKPPTSGVDPERHSYCLVRDVQRSGRQRLGAAGGHRAIAGPRRHGRHELHLADRSRRRLRRAEAAHGEHEKRTGQRDADWPSWYAAYMVAEQTGKPLPT